MSGLEFKRGDTLSIDGEAPIRPGGYVGWTLNAQIRRWGPGQAPGELIANLDCDWTDAAAGKMGLQFTSPTDDWPLGEAVFDIRYTPPGGGRHTTRGYVRLTILEPATRG